MRTNKAWGGFLATPGFKKYFANTSWLMAEKIFRMAIALSVGVYVVRYLGHGRFGILSYAMSFVALFSALSTLGLNGILVRELVNFPEKREELLGTAFILKLIGAGIVLILLSLLLYFMGSDKQNNLIIFIIAAGSIFQSFNVIRFYFEANVLSKYFVFAQFVSLIAVSVAKLIFIWLGLPLIYFALAVLIESLIMAIGLSGVYFKQKLNIFNWQFSFKTATGLLKNSWPLILSAIAISLYMRIDQVMIKHMLNDEAVGQYAAAVRLSEVWYFIPMIICISLFPAVINAKKRSKDLYYVRLQKLYDLMVWTAMPIILVIMFSANHIVEFLYGGQFSKAGCVLAIHIWAGVFVFLGVASGKWYLAENLQLFSFLNSIIGAVVNIVLNVILIERYGIIGAAWATIISYGCSAYFLNFAYAKTMDNFYRLSQPFNLFRITQRIRNGKYK